MAQLVEESSNRRRVAEAGDDLIGGAAERPLGQERREHRAPRGVRVEVERDVVSLLARLANSLRRLGGPAPGGFP